MSDDYDDHPSLKDYPIDDSYIDPPRRRADVSVSEEESDDIDFSAIEDAPTEASDVSYKYWTADAHGLGGTNWDHEIDESSPQEHDGRARTRTGFDPRESSDFTRFKRLAMWQDGMWADERRTRSNQADQRRAVGTYSTVLGLTDYQKQRTLKVVEELNFKHMAHYGYEIVVLSIISIVLNEDGRWVRDEKAFQDLARDLEASMRDIRSCRLLVKRKSKYV